MKKIMMSLFVGVLALTSVLSVGAAEKIEMKMSIEAGPLTINQPEYSNIEGMKNGDIEFDVSELVITNGRGRESDWSAVANFSVIAQDGTINRDAMLILTIEDTSTIEGMKTAFNDGLVQSGETFTLAKNHYYDTGGLVSIKFDRAIIKGLNKGDQIQLSFNTLN